MKETKKKAPERAVQDKSNNGQLKITLEDLKKCKPPVEFVYLTKTNCCDKIERIELTLEEVRKLKAGFNQTKSHCSTKEGCNKVYNVCKRCNIVQPDSENTIEEELPCFVCGDVGSCKQYSSSIQDIVISYANFLKGCLYAGGFAFKTQAFEELLEESQDDNKKSKKVKDKKIIIANVYNWNEDSYISTPGKKTKELNKPVLLPLAVVPVESGRWSPKKPKFPIFGLERL